MPKQQLLFKKLANVCTNFSQHFCIIKNSTFDLNQFNFILGIGISVLANDIEQESLGLASFNETIFSKNDFFSKTIL